MPFEPTSTFEKHCMCPAVARAHTFLLAMVRMLTVACGLADAEPASAAGTARLRARATEADLLIRDSFFEGGHNDRIRPRTAAERGAGMAVERAHLLGVVVGTSFVAVPA